MACCFCVLFGMLVMLYFESVNPVAGSCVLEQNYLTGKFGLYYNDGNVYRKIPLTDVGNLVSDPGVLVVSSVSKDLN